MSIEEQFLEGCKVGDLDLVRSVLAQGCDVNLSQGWGLRRAVRYSHPGIWRVLLSHKDIKPNLQNQYGLSALHTACRFNNPEAVRDLLKHPGIKVNEKTRLGSSPVMVAAKYCRKEALVGLIKDRRVDLDSTDSNGRRVDEVVAVAVLRPNLEDKADIVECVTRERLGRREEEGRRDSMEEENIDVDGLHKLRVFDKVKELVAELRSMHDMARIKLIGDQEQESARFVTKLELDLVAFLGQQRESETSFINKLINDKKDFDQRQQEALGRLLKTQDQETLSLQGGCGSIKSTNSDTTSPKSGASRPNSRRPSLKTHMELPSCESLSDSSGPSLWEWTVPDEGYCTGSAAAGEVPVMLDSARKELECPICMEVMMPPARIWQCKVGHVICEPCKDRVRHQTLATASLCPTCKTAPFIGRNLALERISRSLFSSAK